MKKVNEIHLFFFFSFFFRNSKLHCSGMKNINYKVLFLGYNIKNILNGLDFWLDSWKGANLFVGLATKWSMDFDKGRPVIYL